MKHILLSIAMLGMSLAARAVDDGTYYFYDVQDGAYLSRGANYGTRATLDRLGVPVEVTNKGTSVTLRYLDSPVGTQTKYLGNANGTPYTDISGAFTPRHGSVLPITQPEEAALLKAFPTTGYTPSPVPTGVAVAKTAVDADASYDLLGRQAAGVRAGQICVKGGRKVMKRR